MKNRILQPEDRTAIPDYLLQLIPREHISRFLTPDYINTDIPNTITAFLPVYSFGVMRNQMCKYIYELGIPLTHTYHMEETQYISADYSERCAYIYIRLNALYHIDKKVKNFIDKYQLYVKLDHAYQTVEDHFRSFFLIIEDKKSVNGESRFHVRVMHEDDIYSQR